MQYSPICNFMRTNNKTYPRFDKLYSQLFIDMHLFVEVSIIDPSLKLAFLNVTEIELKERGSVDSKKVS